MIKTFAQILEYIVKNVKPYGYTKYPFIYDGLQAIKPYDPVKELENLEEKCRGLRKYIAHLDNIKAAIKDSSKLKVEDIEYIKHYIDHPETNSTTPYIFTTFGKKSYTSSYEILSQANYRATLVIEYEYVMKAIDNIITNLKKDPKFYSH